MSRKSQHKTTLQVEVLEGRALMSASPVFLDPVKHTIQINGTELADTAVVRMEKLGGRDYYRVDLQSGAGRPQTFRFRVPKGPMQVGAEMKIEFAGNGGDDKFTNLTGLSCTADGGAGNDVLIGGSGNDHLLGGDGNDLLDGKGGNDELCGNAGNDRLYGGKGDDVLWGGAGEDWLFGEEGDDHLYGNEKGSIIGWCGTESGRNSPDGCVDHLSGGAGRDTFHVGYRIRCGTPSSPGLVPGIAEDEHIVDYKANEDQIEPLLWRPLDPIQIQPV